MDVTVGLVVVAVLVIGILYVLMDDAQHDRKRAIAGERRRIRERDLAIVTGWWEQGRISDETYQAYREALEGSADALPPLPDPGAPRLPRAVAATRLGRAGGAD